MRAKYLISIVTLIGCCGIIFADAPEGYYSRLDGKKGEELKAMLKEVSQPAEFVSIEFGDGGSDSFKTWQCFTTSDSREVGGRMMWWDMYSNNIVYTADLVGGFNTKSLNIEHAVPNSWWGGKAGNLQAYQDIFNLNPSNSEANNKKSANPIGVTVSSPAYNNGMTKIGKPAEGYGGNSTTVFEPADEYKGDFARTYFYMFAAYPDINWTTNKGGENIYEIKDGKAELLPWVKTMLLKWNAEDPVDSKEMKRNDEIFKCQKNRNPFIDMPGLADYIWGDMATENFNSKAQLAEISDRPASPYPEDMWMTGVNTYSKRYWDSTVLSFDTDGSDLWISIDGGNYQQFATGVNVTAAKSHGETHTIKAYCEKVVGKNILRSSIVEVTFIAKDEKMTDYSAADYAQVKYGDAIDKNGKYLILDAMNNHVMGMLNSTFMTDCWFPCCDGEKIVGLPQTVAIVEFVQGPGDACQLKVSDKSGVVKGYWNNTASNKMKLDQSSGTPATIAIQDDNTVNITFSVYGNLQYNQTSPRFLNYSSVQGKVKLYRFVQFNEGSADVEELESEETDDNIFVKDGNIISPNGSAIFNIHGIKMRKENIGAGIYIVISPKGKTKKIIL